MRRTKKEKKEKRIKSLKPSHREKKRYVLIKGTAIDDVENCIMDFLGVLGYVKACPVIVRKRKNSIILSVNRGCLNEIKSSILMCDRDLEVVKVSGSIKNIK